MQNPTIQDHRAEADTAFEKAIHEGRLSCNPAHPKYAGDYMYMGKACDGRTDAFKHRMTREYLKARI